MSRPIDPVAAVTHADPYSYYASLVANQPFHHNQLVGTWVAASAGAVTTVLSNPSCRVRPAAEPTPPALIGSVAGDIFARLVRMTDGSGHEPLRRAVSSPLSAIDQRHVRQLSRAWSHQLVMPTSTPDTPPFAFCLPVLVLGSLLGLGSTALERIAGEVDCLVSAFSPLSGPDERERGIAAAESLRATTAASIPAHPDTPLAALAHAGVVEGLGRDVIVANAIGLMTQACEATAGLIANTIVALWAQPDIRAELAVDPPTLERIVTEVARWDPPVQNTRRYVADDCTLLGQPLRRGDSVLVVLAAANRDPAANAEPDRFDPWRTRSRCFTFGAGPHACPGQHLALPIAVAGVEALLGAELVPDTPPATIRYRPSANTRIPLLRGITSPRDQSLEGETP